MTKIFYKEQRPNDASLILTDQANSIINEYRSQGYVLTLRQLYYRCVARDIIANTDRSYKNLSALITRARMAGLVSWEAIEDRNREHNAFWYQEDDFEVIRKLPRYIRFDRWARQDYYIEVWVEKEALGNVVSRACNPWLVPHMACKGYLSASEAWRAGRRFLEKINEGKKCILIHLGDHDPSGIDMTRDNRERLELFTEYLGDVEVKRIALNKDQVDQYKPPPNPAKVTDSRAAAYIQRYGLVSWELDALEPRVMEKLIIDEIKPCIDFEVWNDAGDQEDEMESVLGKLYSNWEIIKQDLLFDGDTD